MRRKLPNVHVRFLGFTANWKVGLAEILTVPPQSKVQSGKASRYHSMLQVMPQSIGRTSACQFFHFVLLACSGFVNQAAPSVAAKSALQGIVHVMR